MKYIALRLKKSIKPLVSCIPLLFMNAYLFLTIMGMWFLYLTFRPKLKYKKVLTVKNNTIHEHLALYLKNYSLIKNIIKQYEEDSELYSYHIYFNESLLSPKVIIVKKFGSETLGYVRSGLIKETVKKILWKNYVEHTIGPYKVQIEKVLNSIF